VAWPKWVGYGVATAAAIGIDYLLSEGKPVKAPGIPTAEDGYLPPKNWNGEKVPSPNGGGYGYPDRNGNVWIPTGPGGRNSPAHGGPHWDVQIPGGGHRNVRPTPKNWMDLELMKNIQIIDGAENCNYAIFKASDELFDLIFPELGQDVEFIEDVWERVTNFDEKLHLFDEMWNCPVLKCEAIGIHGTLFYQLYWKKKFYPTKRETEMIACIWFTKMYKRRNHLTAAVSDWISLFDIVHFIILISFRCGLLGLQPMTAFLSATAMMQA
jgi:uncharacterized protein YozE (UPF0346 family)